MKTKFTLIAGIVISLVLIAIAAIQIGIVQESKSDYRYEQEHNRIMGYNEPYIADQLTPYAKKTRMAGYMTIPFVLSILAVCGIVLKKAREIKWISLFNYGLMLISILLLAFTLTGVRTTTGGITFDEIGALWIVFGVISIAFSSVGLIKLHK